MSFSPPIESSLKLLPLDSKEWDWKDFERFCLDVINALPDVAYADFHGAQGDKQDGIDILAELTTGKRRTYQCKKYKSFGPKRAEKAVKEDVYQGAAEHVLLVSCTTSVKTQKYVREQPGWRILDKEGISSVVRAQLDREAARRIVEHYFGAPIRRAFLGPTGATTFVEPRTYFAPFERGDLLFRHDWTLAGRRDVMDLLSRELAAKRVVVLPGRGGIGKTRLLRELSAELTDVRILFAVDDVTITAEAAEDLPLAPLAVVVDDVHRRDDLGPLLAEAVRRQKPVTLLLATRPQRLDELRGALTRAGYPPEEIFVAEPLDDLAIADTEDLARQALGPTHQSYASALACATSDCPLVTVVGGQLLATRAVAPELLEREVDFRTVVLSRWQDEIIGHLGKSFDPKLVADALLLIAALAPLSVGDLGTVDMVAADLGIDPPALVQLLGALEEVGLILARGRLRRIIPDVLADHILHRACLDPQGRPTGYADQLIHRYAATSLAPLLRNLAELDWRIGQTAGASELLDDVWRDLTNAFTAASAAGRLELLGRIRSAAVFAPRRVLEIVEVALREPARPAESLFGGPIDDSDVRAALPNLLARVGQHGEFAARVVSHLWQLGRDDDRRLNSHPDHPIRLAQELGNYSISITHDEALLDLVTQLLDAGETDNHYWSPLELLRGLVSRTVERTHSVGFALQLRTQLVNAGAVAQLRERVFAAVAEEGSKGSPRNQHLAADLLGEALRPPSLVGGQEVSGKQREQWHEEELRLMEMAADLISTGPPILKMELRRRASWFFDLKIWSDVAAAARAAVALPVDDLERMLSVFAYPYDVGGGFDQMQAELAAYGTELASDSRPDARFIDALNGAIELLDRTTNVSANPRQPLFQMARDNPERAIAIANWAVDHPDSPLSRFVGSVLGPLRSARPDELRALLGRLDTDDVGLRRELADYFQSGAWFGDPWQSDVERMRRLVRDHDPWIRRVAVGTLLPLTNVQPALATDLALDADTSDSSDADLVDHVLSTHTTTLTSDQLDARLGSLEREKRLSWSSWQLLRAIGKEEPQRVLELLLTRAHSTALDLDPIYETHEDIDVLAGFNDDEYRDALRTVREEALGVSGLVRRRVGQVFWALDRNDELLLGVLGEWLVDPELDRVQAAARLFDPLPFARLSPRDDFDRGWQLLLDRGPLLSQWLDAASRNGADHGEVVRESLTMALVGGISGRGMGEANERHVKTRDRAHELAELAESGSLAQRFWADLAAGAEQEISDDRLEDVEFSE